MNKNKQKQSGFAHLAVVIILSVALLGTLGFVFWQNFMQPKVSVTKPVVIETKEFEKPAVVVDKIEYKTFTTDKYSISFQYPSTWSLANPISSDEYGFFTQSVNLLNTDGNVVAKFATGVQGLGGTCDKPVTYSVIDSVPTSVKGVKPVSLSFSVISSQNGGYDAYYGLSEGSSELGDGKVCANTFYQVFEPTIDNSLMSFGSGVSESIKHFDSLASAKDYLTSDEYKAIKKMILSLTY